MKKIYIFLVALFFAWQGNAQVLNQNAGWPNAAWTVTGTYSTNVGVLEANPTTSPNFAFDDDDAGANHEDNIAAESPVINLTAADAAGESKVRVSVMYGYNFLPTDQLRFEYWDADTSTWNAWGANIPGNNTLIEDNFCTITKTMFMTPDLDIAPFTPTQLSGFKYRIAYDDNPAGTDWNWGFCFDSPTIISIPQPCLTGTNYPTGTLTITANCDGVTPTQIASDSHAGDYYNMNVTTGQTYKFTSSVGTDFYTLSTDNGATAVASGTQPLTWVSTVNGVLRVHLNTNIACGTQNVDRTTTVICGAPCLNGTGPYPTATYTPAVCNGTTVNQVAANSWAGEYSNINMFSTNTYTIASSVATDYITVASADGTTALAIGTGSMTFTPAANGVYRVYFHLNSACGTANVDRIKTIVCTTTAVLPGCPVNVFPVNGSTTVPAFTPIILTWSAPTTGDPVTSYIVYAGVIPTPLNLIATVPGTTFTYDAGAINAYNSPGYWQIIAVNAAGQSVGCATWSFTTAPQPTTTPDFVNLQFPPTITITEGGSGTVYGQVYEPGLTDVAPNIVGQAPGILAWVGISAIGDNSDPATWTNWIPATWNAGHVSNNDEYEAAIGATLAPGTYYYATRFSLTAGPFVYGGLNNGFWNATTNPSGVLTVNPAPPPSNDECSGAIPLTPGNNFSVSPLTTTNIGSTNDALIPTCQPNFSSNVWYSVVVPASGTLTIETQANGGMTDSVVSIYSGSCGSLTELGCDDDTGIGTMSLEALTGLTPGNTLYISVWRWLGIGSNNGSFIISAYDGSLGNSTFDDASFVAYPNPVKDLLNISYSENIEKVQIVNMLGQEVITKSINATQSQIDMSNLAVGTYLVRVTSGELVKTIKVIKE